MRSGKLATRDYTAWAPSALDLGKTAPNHTEAVAMAVIVTNDFPPNRGGVQRLVALLAGELASRGEKVIVVAPKVAGSEAFDARAQFRVFRYPNSGRVFGFVAMTLGVFWALLTSRDPLTIASMWFPGGLAACIVPGSRRKRFAVLAHGTEIAPSRGGIRRRLMRYVFGRADVIIANSAFTRDLLLEAGVRSRIAVVHPGIDAVPIAPVRSAVPTILSVGRLIARKGFDTVISALPAILQKFPSARYEIVGSGPQRAELAALATRLGVESNVIFLGATSDEEMHEAYARAWLFALPVRAIADDVEGFGIVYLEAAMADLPAIGGRNSGAEDAIASDETGLLVDGTSSHEVATAIIALFEDRDRAQRMGIAGRQRVLRDFTMQRSVANVAAALDLTTPNNP